MCPIKPAINTVVTDGVPTKFGLVSDHQQVGIGLALQGSQSNMFIQFDKDRPGMVMLSPALEDQFCKGLCPEIKSSFKVA